MLTLIEYVESDHWINKVDEQIVSMTEGYSLSFDQKKCKTVVQLFDSLDKIIVECSFDSAEMAIALLEDYFDLDEGDQNWNDSYDWVLSENKIDEALESVEKYIQRNADEYQVRIDYMDGDAFFDDLMGIEIFFHPSNNKNDLSSFVKEVSYDMMRTYGAQSYDFDGMSWKIAL
jgi:hypothetical protein